MESIESIPRETSTLQIEPPILPLSLPGRAAFSVGSLGSGMFNGFFNSALPLFLMRYNLPYTLLGFLAQERSFLGSLLEPVIGTVSDRTRSRFGRRRPFLPVGAVLTALSLLILAQSPPLIAMVVLLSLLPFLLAIANVPYRAMMADIAPPAQRGGLGGMMSLAEMAGQVGVLLLLYAAWSTNETLVFLAIAASLVGGFGVVFLAAKEPPQAPTPAPAVHLANPLAYARRVLAFREAAKYVGCQFVFWFGVGGVTPFLTRYAVAELGIEEGTAFLLFLLLVACTALFSIPAGVAGDMLGKKRVLSAGLLLFAAATFVGSQASTVPQLAVALAVIGFANGITTSLGFAFLTELLPRRRMGELTGLSSMTWSFAQPLGSVFAGFVADQTGTLRAVFLLTSLALVISLLILTTVNKPAEPPPVNGAGTVT